MSDGVHIRPATTPADIEAVRVLCWAYRDFLLNHSGTDRDITETFYPVDKYQRLMDGLEAEHARPQGIMLLAEVDGVAVGCGMTHAIDPQTIEVKRVFVSEAVRGQRIADRLCRALMDQARSDGYTRVVLDTSRSLIAAQRLYERLGFEKCPPYQPIPEHALPHLVFYEARL
ncbi:MAG: GNAT family N-acetyltransferase [Sulfitobacter sp.]